MQHTVGQQPQLILNVLYPEERRVCEEKGYIPFLTLDSFECGHRTFDSGIQPYQPNLSPRTKAKSFLYS
jgi:hypothetical protein